ncbi:MAG: hypothetical protein ACKOU6_15460 [Planctomycetota bacterium]
MHDGLEVHRTATATDLRTTVFLSVGQRSRTTVFQSVGQRCRTTDFQCVA